jgi:hypothetical protein
MLRPQKRAPNWFTWFKELFHYQMKIATMLADRLAMPTGPTENLLA